MYLTEEHEVDDLIFDKFNPYETCRTTKNDLRYNDWLCKTHVFKSCYDECYAVTDGVPFVIPYDEGFFRLLEKIPFVTAYDRGVFIIKSYRFRKLSDISILTRYWSTNESLLDEVTTEQIRRTISKWASEPGYKTHYTYRLVDFIPIDDLKRTDYYSMTLNGTISLDIKERYDYKHRHTTVNVELSGNGNTKWMILGDNVIPVMTNSRHKEDKIIVSHSNSRIKEYKLDKNQEPFIFDTYEEAESNILSLNLKQEKVRIEKNKLKLEERKMIMDHEQSVAKHELAMLTIKLNYRSDIVKLMVSENSLRSSEVSLDKSMEDNAFKTLFNIIGAVDKGLKK